jgi:6-phosphogluconate dehydrogenase
MQAIGMIGLGRMGGNMSRRIARGGFGIVAWDRAPEARSSLATERGVRAVETLEALVAALPAPRVVWVMLPAGAPTDDALGKLKPLLARGDVVVDGGNAWYRDSQRRAADLATSGIEFVDAGVSGGVWGLENGYGLMVGGTPGAVARVEPFQAAGSPARPRLAALRAGRSGPLYEDGAQRHRVRTHAGVRRGVLAVACKDELELDVAAIAEAWRHGTVIRSWLLDLTAEFLQHDAKLESIAPLVADSGEGRWTAAESIELGVPTPVMTISLMERFASQGRADFTNRLPPACDRRSAVTSSSRFSGAVGKHQGALSRQPQGRCRPAARRTPIGSSRLGAAGHEPVAIAHGSAPETVNVMRREPW